MQINGFQCRLLPLQFSVPIGTGMVSRCKCRWIQARRTREIRLKRMFGNVPVHMWSAHWRGIVGANPSLDSMSPGSVSRYSSPCFPLRSILTRRPAPGGLLLDFAHERIFHASSFIGIEGAILKPAARRLDALWSGKKITGNGPRWSWAG
jgi:hypothetical protein